MTNYLIIGGSGFLGKHLCRELLNNGENVTVKTRDVEKSAKKFKHFDRSPRLISAYDEIEKNDYPTYVIHLAGAGIIDKRWSKSRKQELINSRVQPIVELKNWLESANHKVNRVLIGSAIGYYGYGEHPEITFHERSAYTKDFVHQICFETEEQSKALSSQANCVISLRTGVVLAPDGGALKKMLAPARFHLNGKIGNGKQWVSWIHIDDWVGAVKHIIKHREPKPAYNLTSSEPVRNAELSKQMSIVMDKPFQLGLPTFSLNFLLGEASVLLNSGQKVSPQNLMIEGYPFSFADAQDALKDLLSKRT